MKPVGMPSESNGLFGSGLTVMFYAMSGVELNMLRISPLTQRLSFL